MEKVNLQTEAELIQEPWNLTSIGKINNHTIKMIKLEGEFEWHTHEDEDKLFMVIEGVLELQMRDKTITVYPNEFIIVPKGVENKPAGKEKATLMIFEPMRD